MNASAPQLRQAVAADRSALLALESLFPGDRLSARSLSRLLRSPSARLWLVEREGRCLGNLILLTRRGSAWGRIYSLVVDPEARGQGLARALVEQAETAGLAAGLKGMYLEVRDDNTAARRLYETLGYQLKATLPAYYEDGADGLRLEKRLAT